MSETGAAPGPGSPGPVVPAPSCNGWTGRTAFTHLQASFTQTRTYLELQLCLILFDDAEISFGGIFGPSGDTGEQQYGLIEENSGFVAFAQLKI